MQRDRPAGAQPQPGQLLRRDRAGRVPSGPCGAGHRLQQRPAAAGPAVLVHRHAALAPGRRQLPRAADQPRRLPVPQLPARRHAPQADERGPGRLRAELAGQWRGVPRRRRQQGFQTFPEAIEPPKMRRRSPTLRRPLQQAALFFNSQSAAEKEHIIAAFQFELSKVELPAVRQRIVDNLAHVDEKLARKVAEALGIARPTPRPRPGAPGFRDHRASCRRGHRRRSAWRWHRRRRSPRARSPCWWPTASRSARFKPIQQALRTPARSCKVVAAHLGFVATHPGQQLAIDHTFDNMPSVMFDAVLVPARRGSAPRRWRATATPCTSCWRPTSIARRSA